jgi:hypothetical protein
MSQCGRQRMGGEPTEQTLRATYDAGVCMGNRVYSRKHNQNMWQSASKLLTDHGMLFDTNDGDMLDQNITTGVAAFNTLHTDVKAECVRALVTVYLYMRANHSDQEKEIETMCAHVRTLNDEYTNNVQILVKTEKDLHETRSRMKRAVRAHHSASRANRLCVSGVCMCPLAAVWMYVWTTHMGDVFGVDMSQYLFVVPLLSVVCFIGSMCVSYLVHAHTDPCVRVRCFYLAWNPSKLEQDNFVIKKVNTYKKNIDELYHTLEVKYGPEPNRDLHVMFASFGCACVAAMAAISYAAYAAHRNAPATQPMCRSTNGSSIPPSLLHSLCE